MAQALKNSLLFRRVVRRPLCNSCICSYLHGDHGGRAWPGRTQEEEEAAPPWLMWEQRWYSFLAPLSTFSSFKVTPGKLQEKTVSLLPEKGVSSLMVQPVSLQGWEVSWGCGPWDRHRKRDTKQAFQKCHVFLRTRAYITHKLEIIFDNYLKLTVVFK